MSVKMELCPNCFETGYGGGSCLRCGYRSEYEKNRSARSLPAGLILKNRYYIGKLLGEGGFGITYKAYDTEKKKICAVKEYAPNGLCRRKSQNQYRLELYSPDNEMPYMAGLKRFLEESRILSRLEQIPSVVDITDTFQENNTAYFVMEYLDGADLRQIVKNTKQRLSVEQATNIILQVAVSMDVIHTRTKIIHRDISPENIYITRDGKVKLIDFGSAKRTETGMKKGLSVVLKPKFAPPEQFSSEMMQGSFTDVYSLASTYYYVLTGNHVPSAPDRLGGVTYVPLKQMNLGVSESVSDAVDRALTLNVRMRTQTMQEFIGGIAPAAGMKPAQSGVSQQAAQQAAQRNAAAQQAMQQAARRNAVSQQNPPRRNAEVQGQQQKNQAAGKKIQTEIPYVTVTTGPEAGKSWVLPPNRVLIFGRSMTEAHLRIQYPEDVSRLHCQLAWHGDMKKFSIRDVSVNGTYYKGQRLKKNVEYFVKPPAKFMLSSTSCIIEVGIRYEYR